MSPSGLVRQPWERVWERQKYYHGVHSSFESSVNKFMGSRSWPAVIEKGL